MMAPSRLYYKTLGTSVINSPFSPLSLSGKDYNLICIDGESVFSDDYQPINVDNINIQNNSSEDNFDNCDMDSQNKGNIFPVWLRNPLNIRWIKTGCQLY